VAQRILQGAAATLTVTICDAVGEPADPTGTVTVGVVNAAGTVVITPGTATTRPSPTSAGQYRVASPAATQLDEWTATWTNGTSGWVTTYAVVGGFPFSATDAYLEDTSIAVAKFPPSIVIDARAEVEDEAEEICNRSFTPRYRRVTLDGSGTSTLVLPVNDIRRIRAATVNGATLTVSYLRVIDDEFRNQVQRIDRRPFEEDFGNVVLDVEYGLDGPPSDVRRAMLTRLRSRLAMPRTSIPDKANTFQGADGRTYTLNRATADSTGIDDVDAAYERHSLRKRAGQASPASRPMNFDPQRSSLFHGGIR
jgi:hypothetical protein